MAENNKQIMVDIETLGTTPGSILLSIAAVEFDLKTGETFRTFNEVLNCNEAFELGFKACNETLKWWENKPAKATKILELSRQCEEPNRVTICKFALFLLGEELYKKWLNFSIDLKELNTCLWGNSNRFDLGLLFAYYENFNYVLPWNHFLERDVRTLVSFYPEIKKEMPFDGVKHDALADCFHQIKYCVATYNKLKA